MCARCHRPLGSSTAQSRGRCKNTLYLLLLLLAVGTTCVSFYRTNDSVTVAGLVLFIMSLSTSLSLSSFSPISGLFSGGRRGHGRGPLRRLHLTLPVHHRITGIAAPCGCGTRHQRVAAQTGAKGRVERGATGSRVRGRAHLCLLQVCLLCIYCVLCFPRQCDCYNI